MQVIYEADKALQLFNQWKNNLTVSEDGKIKLTSTLQRNGTVKEMLIDKEELESFTQCYTEDTRAKYYKARQGFPQYWFISKRGNLLSVKNGEVHFVMASNGKREQYEISCARNGIRGQFDGFELDPAMIVCLCFDGESYPEAQEMLDKYGLEAISREKFGKKCVRLHHKKGYKRLDSVLETRAINCELDKIVLLTDEVHDIHTWQPRILSSEAIVRNMKLATKFADKNEITVFTGVTGKGGERIVKPQSVEVIEDVLDKADRVMVTVHPCLVFSDGKEVIRGKDVPAGFYDVSLAAYKDVIKERFSFAEQISIAYYEDKEIFGSLRSVS